MPTMRLSLSHRAVNTDQNYQIVGQKELSGEIQTRILRWTLDLNRYRHLDDLRSGHSKNSRRSESGA
jgi:hypothetical protein